MVDARRECTPAQKIMQFDQTTCTRWETNDWYCGICSGGAPTGEYCDIESSCEVSYEVGTGCNDNLPDCDYEICGNGLDDDCDGAVDEDGGCRDEVPCNGQDDNLNGVVDEGTTPEMCACGRVDGQPVDLWTREMSVGPHEIARVASGVSTLHDLVITATYASARARADFAQGQDATGAQAPYLRTLGPGFRHSFEDRLFLRGVNAPSSPAFVEWETSRGTIRLYRTSGSSYRGEVGQNLALEKTTSLPSGNTWRLVNEEGDVLWFKESAGTLTHPWSSGRYSARLTSSYPRNAAQFRFVVQYEGDPIGTGMNDLPAGACDDVTPGVNSCDPSRGLPVRVAAQWLGATPKWGQAVELQYASYAPTLAYWKPQTVLRAVRISTDREDGAATAALPILTRVDNSGTNGGGGERRLFRLRDALACGDTQYDALCVKHSYAYKGNTTDPRWAITQVKRGIIDSNGTASEALEETFDWTGGGMTAWFVSNHASQGVTLATTSAVGAKDMTWVRNGESQTTSFDFDGNPIQCASGLCGDPDFTRSYGKTDDGIPTGLTTHRTRDGLIVQQDYDSQGRPFFRCEIAETASGAQCTLNLAVQGGTFYYRVDVVNAELRSATMTYYDYGTPFPLGARVVATASYLTDVNAPPLSPKFPVALSDTNWGTRKNVGLGSCPSASAPATSWTPPSDTARFFDVTVISYDSDGDGVLDEPGAFGDRAPVRWWRASVHNVPGGGTAVTSQCTVKPLDATLRASTPERRYFNGVQVKETQRSYALTTATPAKTRGRLTQVARVPDISSPATTVISWAACSPLSSAVDAEGQTTCLTDPVRASMATSFRASDRARVRTTSLGDGSTTLLQTEEIVSASGDVLEARVVGGNGTMIRRTATASATGVASSDVREVGSSNTVLSRTTWTFTDGVPATEPAGFVEIITRHQGLSTVQATRTYGDYTQDGWPGTFTDELGATDAIMTLNYEEWGDPAVVVEPDQQGQSAQTEYIHTGTGAAAQGRVTSTQRRVGANTYVTRTYGYNRRGDLTSTARASGITADTMEYDAWGQLLRETLNSAGVQRDTQYGDVGLPSRLTTSDIGGANARTVYLLYDDMGRLLMRCANLGCTIGEKQVFRYDGKGSGAYIGTHVVGGRSIEITNNSQSGRLGYAEDGEGVTFFEYDALGRVKSVVRHAGPLASFNASGLTETEYTYSSGTPGTLDEVQYPSGRRVRYLYGVDKERPQTLQVEVTAGSGSFTTVLGNVTYHSSGAPASWTWGSGSGTGRVVTRDLLGRVTRIQDTIGGVLRSDVEYPTYELDGDLEQERENVAPTALVSSAATAPVTRTHDVNLTRNLLTTWQDDVATHSMGTNTTGRRSTEIIGGSIFSYSYASATTEQVQQKLWAGGVSPQEAFLTWGHRGELSDIDWGAEGVNDLSLAYNFLGAVGSETVPGSGTITHSYDGFMRLVFSSGPVGSINRRWLYALADQPVQERSASSAFAWNITETLYLQGEPVAFIVRTNFDGTQTLRYALTDRMGVVRKSKTTAGASVNRLIMDAWGSGAVVSDGASNPPLLGWRYPGQYQNPTTGLINNRWRSYVPSLGMYTSPEPLHAETASLYGSAVAYGYALGRPFSVVDRNGQRPAFDSCNARPDLCYGSQVAPVAPAPSNPGAGAAAGAAMQFLCWAIPSACDASLPVPSPPPFDPSTMPTPFSPPEPRPGPVSPPSGNPTPIPGCERDKSCVEQWQDCIDYCGTWAVKGRHAEFARCIRLCNDAQDECERMAGR